MELQRASEGSYIVDFKDLSIGEHHFDFHVGGSLFALYEGCGVLDGDCEVSIELARAETMLSLQVAIDGEVVVECDRCLDPCSVAIDFEEPLVIKFTDEEELLGEYDGEVMWLPTTSASVDLAHYIYESIIISLPYQRTHAEGECNAEMIAHFTPAEELSEEEMMQEGEEEESVSLPAEELAKLAALKEKMTKR